VRFTYYFLCISDPESESRISIAEAAIFQKLIYVPRDERFGHLKMSDFVGYSLKALADAFVPLLDAAIDLTPMEFDTFQDVLNMFEGGIALPNIPLVNELKKQIPFELIKELLRSDGENLFRLPTPQVIQSKYYSPACK